MGNLVSLRSEFRTNISQGSVQVLRCYLQTDLFICYFLAYIGILRTKDSLSCPTLNTPYHSLWLLILTFGSLASQ